VLASALTRIPRTTEGFPIMANVTIPIQFAPGTLEQPILPGWQFSLFSVNLGESSNPEVEKAASAAAQRAPAASAPRPVLPAR